MQLIDLTRMLDPEDIHRLPESMKGSAQVMVPKIDYVSPKTNGVDAMCRAFGCEAHDLPNGEGWGSETLHIHTHLGTHVDAPLHYGSTCEGKPSRTITDLKLEELYCDGLVLDLRNSAIPNEGITVAMLEAALKENGGEVTPGCAIMLRTGQEKFEFGEPGWFQYPGMTRESTLFLAGLGAKILGTDALGWDRPFPVIREVFKKTGDRAEIWDAHFAGRDKEIFIIQQLDNLAALPANGFKVGFFPLKLARCSAAPARVVAFVN